MVTDIKGFGGVKAAEKSKSKPQASSAGGPSFASLLEDAQGVTDATNPAPAALDTPTGYVPLEEDVPHNPRQQAQELLKTLQTLAEDALSGAPTHVVNRLEQLTHALEEEGLTEQQKEALNEAKTRAAVEAAKLKS